MPFSKAREIVKQHRNCKIEEYIQLNALERITVRWHVQVHVARAAADARAEDAAAVAKAAAEGLAAEVLLERVEPNPGQQIVRPYAILGRDWRHNDTLLEVIKRGAVMANEAIKTAAAEAAAEAEAAEASGEAMEEHTRQEASAAVVASDVP